FQDKCIYLFLTSILGDCRRIYSTPCCVVSVYAITLFHLLFFLLLPNPAQVLKTIFLILRNLTFVYCHQPTSKIRYNIQMKLVFLTLLFFVLLENYIFLSNFQVSRNVYSRLGIIG